MRSANMIESIGGNIRNTDKNRPVRPEPTDLSGRDGSTAMPKAEANKTSHHR